MGQRRLGTHPLSVVSHLLGQQFFVSAPDLPHQTPVRIRIQIQIHVVILFSMTFGIYSFLLSISLTRDLNKGLVEFGDSQSWVGD